MNIYIAIIVGSLLFGSSLVCFMTKNIILGVICIILIFTLFYADTMKIGPGLAFEFKRKISDIEKSIVNLNRITNDIYQGFSIEKVTIEDLGSRLSIIKRSKDSYVYIFKLRYTPLVNSIDLLWGIAFQPPDSYQIINNLLIFSSKEDLSSIKDGLHDRFIIRYFKNLKQGRSLEVNDIEIKDNNYSLRSLNRTFKTEDFIQQRVIFE